MSECMGNCNICTNARCIFDDEGKRKYTVTQKALDAYERRKNTLTDKQKEAIRIYEEGQRTKQKATKEYKRAYSIIRYMRDREKFLEWRRKRRYADVQERVLQET